jgi:hypothetical protein
VWSLWMFKDGTNGGGPLDFLTPPKPVPRKIRFRPWQPDRWTRQMRKQKKNLPGENPAGRLDVRCRGTQYKSATSIGNWILHRLMAGYRLSRLATSRTPLKRCEMLWRRCASTRVTSLMTRDGLEDQVIGTGTDEAIRRLVEIGLRAKRG